MEIIQNDGCCDIIVWEVLVLKEVRIVEKSEEYQNLVLKYPMYDILLQHYLQSNSPKKLSQ